MHTKIGIPLVLLALAVTTSGCFYSRELARTRQAIEDQFPEAHLDQRFVINMGPGTLRTLSWFAGFVPREEGGALMSDYLHEMRRVKVGVYEVNDLADAGEVELAELSRFRDRGWEVIVKTREDDEVVWVLYRAAEERVRDFYVLALTDDELVMTRIEGRFDSLVRQVLHDFGPFELRRRQREGTSETALR